MDILIIDDHPLTCQGLASLLSNSVVGARVRLGYTRADGQAAVDAGLMPDWLFLDLHLPDDPDASFVKALLATPWARRTVLISGDVDMGLLRQALDAGVRGFIPKSADPAMVLAGFEAIRRGEVYLPASLAAWRLAKSPEASEARALSPRLREVQDRMLRGASNKAIAREFNISEHTVKEYVSAILAFHGVGNRLALILKQQSDASST